MRVNIKPLSINEAFQGRRFKTKAYKKYERDMLKILPKLTVPEGELSLKLEFGLSARSADIDNPIKCFVDCLQKAYGFDDKMIYKLQVEKVIVKRGKEYIDFTIKGLAKTNEKVVV